MNTLHAAPEKEQDGATTAAAERFELLERLGQGGMGCVFKARDVVTGDVFALKRLHERHRDNPAVVERFEREARFAARIRHVNVATVHGIVELRGARYLKMEHVDGTTLAAILKARKRLAPQVAVRLMEQICAGVQAAHDAGLVHRDLKPANILVAARDGRAVILDFGIARSEEDEGFTQDGMLLGSLDYMSPEQLAGRKVTARADVYSLGVLLYEMLTGVCPFRRADLTLPMRMQIRQRVDDPREHVPDLDDPLVKALAGCLEPEAARRWESPRALSDFMRQGQGESLSDEREHVVLVDGSPVLLRAAPLAVIVAPPGELRDHLVDRMTALGCRTTVFEDGRDALIHSLQHHCHVLLMCETTEGMDPWEACAVMKQYARLDSTRRLVLVEGPVQGDSCPQEAGVAELVQLPLDDDDFASRIRELLD